MKRFSLRLRSGVLLAAAGLALVIGAAPLMVSGADHLDAPALGGLTNAMGDFAPHSDRGERDINDVYVFEGSNPGRTVLAMTTNPATNVPSVQPMPNFGTNVRYIINVDRNGDAVQDLAYVTRFGAPNGAGDQTYRVWRHTGSNARSLSMGLLWAWGSTSGSGIGAARDGGRIFGGERSDPFAFDLTGFIGTAFGIGSDQLSVIDGTANDFFVGLNTNAIVIEVPDDALGATNIGVWGATQYWKSSCACWKTADQMGRPAINTVFNTGLVDADPGDAKNDFNRTPPSQQATAQNGRFYDNVVETLMGLNPALGLGAGHSLAGAQGLANVLLPDVLTYDVTKPADFDGSLGGDPLNGRALADDVIDIELAIATVGVVTTDGVPTHGDYLPVFPYLGAPH
jgi:hypothetical protein